MGKPLDKIEFLTFGTLTHPNKAYTVSVKNTNKILDSFEERVIP